MIKIEINRYLKETKNYLKKLMLKIFSENEIKDFMLYLSNPAKYPQIVDIIKRVKVKIIEKKDLFSPNDYIAFCNWLDDELAFAILINQNSKCDPFKFINF